jgi:ParB family chromosome partitioning protein
MGELARKEEGREERLPLDSLVPQAQPRRRFESLDSLAESVRKQGVLQPLLVRPLEDGRYAIVAGERRYRAARMAGLAEVPVQVLKVGEREARRIALVENLQREDLNPYEETLGVLALLEEDLGMSREGVVGLLRQMKNAKEGRIRDNVAPKDTQKVEEAFKALGRMSWESFIRHRLPLLNLPEDLRRALEVGAIPYTAALELKKVGDEETRHRLMREVQAGLSLRDLRARVREALQREQAPTPWHREVAGRLARLDLEALPPARRKAVERHLKALRDLLGR